MGLVLKRRGQISLEFMLVFAIMLIMLLYSVRNVTFSSDSPSNGVLALQIALEEKNIANTIASAIDQVYAQGPGSKVTVYAHFVLLRNSRYISRAFNVSSPEVQILLLGTSDSLFPSTSGGSVVAVAVVGSGNTTPILSGSNRTGVWVKTYFPYSSSSPSSFKVVLNPSSIPDTMRIVVEWNPNVPVSMSYNSTDGTLYINISPGE